MRHAILPTVIMLLTAVTPALLGDPPQEHAAASAEATQDFEARMRHFMWRHGVPGAAVAVAVDGEIVYEQGFGWADVDEAIPVTPDSQFRIGSISKSITAVAILQLVEQGKLSLDDNPFDVIGMADQIRAPEVDPRLQDITIEQCLSHTAGFSGDPMFQEEHLMTTMDLAARPDRMDVVRFVISQPLTRQPGVYWHYSNFGYLLLELVLEAMTEKPYETVIQDQIADPLQLVDLQLGGPLPTDRLAGEVAYYDHQQRIQPIIMPDGSTQSVPKGYSHPPTGFGGAGGLVATAGSLAVISNDLHQEEGSRLLGKEHIRRMWTPVEADHKYRSDYPMGVGYGLGWFVGVIDDDTRNAWHGGTYQGAISAQIVQYSNGCSVAVLFNTTNSALTKTELSFLFEAELLQIAKAIGTNEHGSSQSTDRGPLDP